MSRILRTLMCVLFALVAAEGVAFQPVPKASAKALGVTRGKPFSTGAVFINGKYLEPPYVVERWGTGIRINSIFVTGQIIDWSEFVKTQKSAKPVKETETVMVPVVTTEPATESSTDSADSSLDDLFDDAPKKPAKKTTRLTQTTREVVSYTFEGDFVPNDASKALLTRINAARTEIDRLLRMGGFICFGESYSRVTGDARTLREMLGKLPELMQQATDAVDFSDRARDAHLVYLNEVLREELYANRLDYRKLMELRAKLRKANAYNEVLNDVIKPLL